MSLSNTQYADRTPQVDVNDAQYQADDKFKPDKLQLWSKVPTEADGWVIAHNAVRYELVQFQTAIEAVGVTSKLVAWQVECVKQYLTGHLVHVHEHHSNEDDIFNPAIRARIVYPDKLEADHEAIVACMDAIESAKDELAAGATIEKLAALWTKYTSLMLPHLWEEETVGLPLVRAFFAPAEVGKIVEQFMKNGDPVSMGAVAHVMGSKAANMAFMKDNGIPTFVWHIPGKGFKALRTLYRKKMQSQVDSLVAGRVVSSVHTPRSAKTALKEATKGDENAVAQCLSPIKRSSRVLTAR